MTRLPGQHILAREGGVLWIKVAIDRFDEGEVRRRVHRPAVSQRRIAVDGVDSEAIGVCVDEPRHMLAVGAGR